MTERKDSLFTLDVSEPDPKNVRREKLLNLMLLGLALSAAAALLVLTVTVPLGVAGGPQELARLATGAVSMLFGAGSIYLVGRHLSGEVAAVLLVLMLIALGAIADVPQQVVSGRGLLTFTIPILAASVLLEPWASFVAAGIISAVISTIGMVFLGQPLPNVPAILTFFLLALVSWASARSLERAADNVRATNRRLRQSEARYRTVFETTGTATIIIEPDMTISLVNAEAERLSGYAKKEIEGRMKWIGFVAPED